MKLETFFEKFDLFADVPDAVAKMRKLVLHLAVTGKLISQDPSDEPAEANFVSLVKSREKSSLKRTKIDGEATAEEPSIPDSWIAVSLGELVSIRTGFAFKSGDYTEQGTFILRVTNINPDGSFDTSNAVFLPEAKLDEKMRGYLLEEHELLVVMVGGSLGKIGQVSSEILPALLNQNMWRLKPYSDQLDYRFLRLVLRDLNENRLQITQSTHGHLAMGTYAAAKVPFPPLAEQKRIVAKVDELMALCDRLGAQQQERETRHAALARASLARFADTPTPANLHFLFHPSCTISPADLRRSILTLAVQGKLVPQDPNDEPAVDLIARISIMRRTNNAKEYKPVTVDDTPYDVPFSWSWVRLGNISLTSDSGWSPQCLPEARSGTEWGVLKVSAVSWGVFKPEENKALPPGMTSRPECEVKAGDFLLSRANTEELVARSVVVDQTPPSLMMSDKIVRFTFPDEIERSFINLVNISEPSRAYYARNASGTSSSMKNIGRQVMCNLPVPLPPLAEQRRIVAKVDQLMTLVDQLETQLAASRATAAKLMEALVAELATLR